MTNDADLIPVYSWLRQGNIDGPGEIKRLHPTIRLLSLALAHPTKVKAQSNHTCLYWQALS